MRTTGETRWPPRPEEQTLADGNHRISCPLIIGHYGGCNTGDEAMLVGLLRAIDPKLRRHTTVTAKDLGIEGGIPALGVSVIPAAFLPVFRALLRSDGLVLGGGTHFHDDYTTVRYLRHFRHMLRITGLSILAKMLGRRVIWLSMGFGPFFRRPTRWVTKLGLRFCDSVTVRDAKSRQEVAAWVPTKRIAVAFDLAALLVGNSHEGIDGLRAEGRRCPTLGVSVTSVRHCMTSGPRVDAVLWRRLAGAVNRILDENQNLRVKVLVIRGGNHEDDRAISAQLHDTIRKSHPGRSDLVPYTPEPTETLRRIAECDAVVATRYHAGVLAYLAHRPLLLLAYHRKVRDLAREIGLSDEACISLAEDVDERLLRERLNRMMAGEEAFRAHLPVQDAEHRAALNLRLLNGHADGDLHLHGRS